MKARIALFTFTTTVIVSFGLWSAASGQGSPVGAPPEVLRSIVLVGDAGDMLPEAEKLLSSRLRQIKAPGALVFMGDNVYPKGIPASDDPGLATATKLLDKQIAIAQSTHLKTVFIPGNHDWDNSKSDGWNAVRREQAYIEGVLGKGSFAPTDACPGPTLAYHDDLFAVIALDSHWWLHQHAKPSKAGDGCSNYTSELAMKQLTTLLSDQREKKVIVVQHHPLVSYGVHRKSSSSQDYLSPTYEFMKREFGAALSTIRPVICAAGHDHDLQLIRGNTWCRNFIVSGSMSSPRPVDRGADTVFASSVPGFFRVDILSDSRVRVSAYGVSPGGQEDQELLLRTEVE